MDASVNPYGEKPYYMPYKETSPLPPFQATHICHPSDELFYLFNLSQVASCFEAALKNGTLNTHLLPPDIHQQVRLFSETVLTRIISNLESERAEFERVSVLDEKNEVNLMKAEDFLLKSKLNEASSYILKVLSQSPHHPTAILIGQLILMQSGKDV